MPHVNSNVDLGKSFERLSQRLLESNKIAKDGWCSQVEAFQAYENLKKGVQEHLKHCYIDDDVTAADPNDLKDINI